MTYTHLVNYNMNTPMKVEKDNYNQFIAYTF